MKQTRSTCPQAAFSTSVKRISLFARLARLARKAGEARRGRIRGPKFEVFGTSNPELRVAPVAHVLLVSLTIHERRERILSGLRRIMVSLRFEPVEIISMGHSE